MKTFNVNIVGEEPEVMTMQQILEINDCQVPADLERLTSEKTGYGVNIDDMEIGEHAEHNDVCFERLA